ncbi:hypothetical protein [Pseudomonas fluorescens]|uniref:hypothetical protein n=1 Tax=Pseudomonas fluorescens TaxID=294 RepID=UPI0028644871|nr:hypothetical protein [Pseudomonas fluorescens]MDR6163072.1 putative DNA-binding transcriptional regulator AlpA [Pseudomonas fluorescens]
MTKKEIDLVERIANGSTRLLSADEICEKLSISRSTFDRWVRNSSVVEDFVNGKGPMVEAAKIVARKNPLFPKNTLFPADKESSTTFPPPDIRIGGSPRWDIETFKMWLTSNLTRPQ